MINGSAGGQVIRTALAFSMLTQQVVRITNIRKKRPDPGLKNQHLEGIRTLQLLSNAKAEGAELGSTDLVFCPGPLKAKSIEIDIETAGSISLLFQTILLPALFADKTFTIKVKGGTDTNWSPPFDYFNQVLLPQLQRAAAITAKLHKRGYYPKGNGEVELIIKPKVHRFDYSTSGKFRESLEIPSYDLADQGHLIHIKGISHASRHLQKNQVAQRQALAAQSVLKIQNCPITIRHEYADTESIGSGITLWAIYSKDKDDINVQKPIRVGADKLGEKNLSAEEVGKQAALNLLKQMQAPVDELLADQLIPFLALFKGKIKTTTLTEHLYENIKTVEHITGINFTVDKFFNTVEVE